MRRKISPQLRKVAHMSNSCRTVKFLIILEPFFKANSALTLRTMLDIAARHGIRFNNLPMFQMFVQRLVRSGIYSKAGRFTYMWNLNETETRILHLMGRLCGEDGGEEQ